MGSQKFSVLQFDAAVDELVVAPVGGHQVGDDLNVVDSRQQVQRHRYREGGEELREPHRRLDGNDRVAGTVEQSERRHSVGNQQERKDNSQIC